MKLYRVCTENKNYPDILDYLDEHFPDGYTVIHANGVWQGKREKSLIIEIFGGLGTDIEKLAYWLRKHNQQNAVLVQVLDVADWLL